MLPSHFGDPDQQAQDLATQGRSARVLTELEAYRHRTGEPDLESELSINEWVGRLQAGAKIAHGFARMGQVQAEYVAWLELAAVCVARCEDLMRVLDAEPQRVHVDLDEEQIETAREIADGLPQDTVSSG